MASKRKYVAVSDERHRVSRKSAASSVDSQKSADTNVFASEASFFVNPSQLAIFKELIKSAVKEALEEERASQNDIILDELCTGASRKDVILDELRTGIKLRSLLQDWVSTPNGKEAMRYMCAAVNSAYVAQQHLPHRKVSKGDLAKELKLLIKEKVLHSGEFLELAKNAIAQCSGLPGEDFLSLVSAYLRTNEQVHVTWSEEKILCLIEQARSGRLKVMGRTPTAWILMMAADIAAHRGWTLTSRVSSL